MGLCPPYDYEATHSGDVCIEDSSESSTGMDHTTPSMGRSQIEPLRLDGLRISKEMYVLIHSSLFFLLSCERLHIPQLLRLLLLRSLFESRVNSFPKPRRFLPASKREGFNEVILRGPNDALQLERRSPIGFFL